MARVLAGCAGRGGLGEQESGRSRETSAVPSLPPVKSAGQPKARAMWGCDETCGCHFYSSLAKSQERCLFISVPEETSVKHPLMGRVTALCGASSNGREDRY